MIRSATVDDFDDILDLSAEFWLQTQFSEPFEREHTLAYVTMAHDHGLLCVAEINGDIVGFCAGVKSPLMGSSQAIAGTELAWYVTPNHRGGKTGVALLIFMEQLAASQGIKYWTMVYMESSMPETVGRMYEKLGYRKAEVCYTKVLHNGSSHSGSNHSGRNLRSIQKSV